MIAGKVVVTYKRKRPSMRADLSRENELLNKPACTISNTSTTSYKHEVSEDQKAENQRKDSEVCVELSAGGHGSNIIQSVSCYHPSHAQSIDSPEDVPEAKRRCCGKSDMKVVTSVPYSLLEKSPEENGGENNPGGTSTKDSYAEERLDVPEAKRHCLEKSAMKEMALAPCSLLHKIPVESGCENNPGVASAKDSYAAGKSNVPEAKRLCSDTPLMKEMALDLVPWSLLEESPVENDCENNPEGASVNNSYAEEKSDVPKVKNLCSEKSDTEEMALAPCSLLEKSPGENDCENNPVSASAKDSNADEKSGEDQRGTCLCISSSSKLEHKCTEIKLAATSALEPGNSEGADSPLQDKPHRSCVNAIGEKKTTSSLITFRRRSKRVKDVNGPDRESNLQGGRKYSAVEASPSGTCSMNLSIHDMYSVENKPSQNVDCTRALDNKATRNKATKEEEQVLSDNPPVAEEADVKVKTEQLSISIDDGSQSPSNHGPDTTQVPDGLGSNGCSVASGAISISPRDSHFVVDCNIALEPEPEPEPDEQSIHNISQECGKLNFTTTGIGEPPSADKEQPTEQEYLCMNAIDHKGNDCVKFSPTITEMTSKKNCLQLFPEYRSNVWSPLGKAQQKAFQCKDFEERNARVTESWSTPKPPSTRSSLFLGCSQPSVEAYANISTSFQWPNVVSHSKEFIQDNQTSSLLRHQMMLDNIVSRARAMEGHRFESPNLWLEEELDSLWVGVRRYGKGNWESMLRDPRLQFFSWRTPRDLADRWQEEIRKLLESVPVSEMNCLRTTELLLLDRLNGLFRSKIGKENPVDDFQLSLGEVYSQPIDGFQNQSKMFKHDMHYQLQKPVSNTGIYSSSCPRKGSRMLNKAMLASKSSPNADPTTRGSLGGNLPPWLKEAVSIPPMCHDPSLLSLASSITCSSTQHRNQPYLQSNGAYDTSRTEQQMNGRARVAFSPVKQHGNNESCQYNVDKQQNLIIIDSDASSEETISDDHSVRP